MALGITQKELDQIDMNLYVALISEADGLDAMGPMHAEYTEIFQRELARIVFPKVFDGQIKAIGDREYERARKQAAKTADEIATEAGTGGSSTLQGIMLRKNLAGVQGDILLAPLVKSHAEKIKQTGGWEGAKQFVMLATHIMKGRNLDRIDQEMKEDLLDEIDASIAADKARQKRKSRR